MANPPKHLQALPFDGGPDWGVVRDCLNRISQDYDLKRASNPAINSFYLFASKVDPAHFYTWNVSNGSSSFKLCLVQYDHLYEISKRSSIRKYRETCFYFFGQLNLKKDNGVCLIKPETVAEKISDVFLKIDIDFEAHPKFSKKYYVAGGEKEKLMENLPPAFFEYMETIKRMEMEFRNKSCVFRLPKSVEIKEALQLCEIGVNLDRILNGK